MKKLILFSVIGGIILFIWQFLSYSLPDFHKSAHAYTPLQDSIMNQIEKLGLEEGMYMLGAANPENPEEVAAAMKEETRTWAVLNYQVDDSNSMTKPLIRSVINCMIIAGLLFWLLKQKPDSTLLSKVLLSFVVGFISFLYMPYSNFIWYKEPDIWAHLMDGVIPWLILGLIAHLFLKPKSA
jgi:hypothetical protein